MMRRLPWPPWWWYAVTLLVLLVGAGWQWRRWSPPPRPPLDASQAVPVVRLAEVTDAAQIRVLTEDLPWAAGASLRVYRVPGGWDRVRIRARGEDTINDSLEDVILMKPGSYGLLVPTSATNWDARILWQPPCPGTFHTSTCVMDTEGHGVQGQPVIASPVHPGQCSLEAALPMMQLFCADHGIRATSPWCAVPLEPRYAVVGVAVTDTIQAGEEASLMVCEDVQGPR